MIVYKCSFKTYLPVGRQERHKDMNKCVRVIDGGGNGFRRADVFGTEVRNLVKTGKGEISSVEKLVEFSTAEMLRGDGVAFAMAGDIDHGLVRKSPQLPWLNGVNLMERTEEVIKKMTLVVNDMDGAVAGMGALLDWPNYFMGITWSSGIGARVCRNGQILASCEAGHTPLDLSPFAPLCGCGGRGCAEAILGGEAMTRRMETEMKIRGIKIPEGIHPLAFLDSNFQLHTSWAEELYGMVAKGMGAYLANIQTLFRLPTVVWKGTFATKALKLLVRDIKHHMRERLINPSWADEMDFVLCPRPEEDALIGAAALFEKAHKIAMVKKG